MSWLLDPRNYHINFKTAFLVNNPVTSLPEPEFSEWNSLAKNFPSILREGEIRSTVENLKSVNCQNLTYREKRCAHVFACHFASGYVHDRSADTSSDRLPASIAEPLYYLCRELGMISTLSAPQNCANYTGNLEDINQLQSIIDLFEQPERSYEWFMLVAIRVEYEFAPVIKAIYDIQIAVLDNDVELARKSLDVIKSSITSMDKVFEKMYQKCDADVFYDDIRPFLSGWKGNPALPDGLFFEGVGKRVYHPGGSAGQSATLATLDTFFGVRHTGKIKEFMDEMRTAMPTMHVKFLEELAEISPRVKNYVEVNDLSFPWNNAVEELVKLRQNHMIMVTKYIINVANRHKNRRLSGVAFGSFIRSKNSPESGRRPSKIDDQTLADTGTGGTPFMMFLKNVVKNTKEACLIAE